MSRAWPADTAARRSVDSLAPYANNARTHTPEQVAQIARSIEAWGWTNPILIDDAGGIIAGHGRVLAAKALGYIDVPVVIATGWSEAEKRAYVIADNQLALAAGWDEETLRAELGALEADGFDLDLIGFGEDELGRLLAPPETDGLTDPDDAPDVPDEPVTVAGDLWVLGRHRLVCGDCTLADTVLRVLGEVRPHLMVTDPPYGVEYDADWRNHTSDLGRSARAVGKVVNDDRADWREAWALFMGDVAYVWHAGNKAHLVAEGLIESGLEVRAQIIWGKNQLVISRGHYHPQHEPCWYAVRAKGGTGHWSGDRTQSTLWHIDKPRKSETGHSTQKPVECMKRPIENNSSPGQAVYEPFSGSGTTIIAAEMTARACYAIEIDPGYCDVAVQRWQDFTGEAATLDGDGRSFAEIAAERTPADGNSRTTAEAHQAQTA
jgi:DNA modification methylase